jgi:hypothetical protein
MRLLATGPDEAPEAPAERFVVASVTTALRILAITPLRWRATRMACSTESFSMNEKIIPMWFRSSTNSSECSAERLAVARLAPGCAMYSDTVSVSGQGVTQPRS